MTPRTLHHADILPSGSVIHLTRAELATTRPKALHTHDFVEIFWVQNGVVRHHQPDATTTLVEGDMILLRPGQPHALQGKGDAGLVVSLALHPALTASLDARLPALPFWQVFIAVGLTMWVEVARVVRVRWMTEPDGRMSA